MIYQKKKINIIENILNKCIKNVRNNLIEIWNNHDSHKIGQPLPISS